MTRKPYPDCQSPDGAVETSIESPMQTPDWSRVLHSDAMVSACGRYRYRLRRAIKPLVEMAPDDWLVVVGLNPSVAGANRDDPTVRRCRGLAQRMGKPGLWLVNAYGLRGSDPGCLKLAEDPVGPDNLAFLGEALSLPTQPIAAWGRRVGVEQTAILAPLSDSWLCLGTNRDGSPKHPLYVASTVAPKPWSPPLGNP